MDRLAKKKNPKQHKKTKNPYNLLHEDTSQNVLFLHPLYHSRHTYKDTQKKLIASHHGKFNHNPSTEELMAW